MKKIFSILMLSMLILASSCTETNAPDMPDIKPAEDIPSTDDTLPADIYNQELSTVFAALDSLNSTIPDKSSRGFLKRFGTFLADQVGRAGGTYCGGPLGGKLGCALTSAAAEYFLEKVESRATPTNWILKYDISIKPSEMRTNSSGGDDRLPVDDKKIAIDSCGPIRPLPGRAPDLSSADDAIPAYETITVDLLGYQHNNAMCEIMNNRNSYLDNNTLDMDRLTNDLVGLMDANSLSLIEINRIQSHAKQIAIITKDSDDFGHTNQDLINTYHTYLQDCRLSNDELHIFTDFTSEIALKCLNQSDDAIHSYAAELNEMLKQLNISEDLKVELAIIAQYTVNSALFWQQ